MGLVARAVEAAGIATLTMSVGRDITEHVRPPRSCFVNFPMGNEIGRPDCEEEQRSIVRAAFSALTEMEEAGQPGRIVDLPFELEAEAPDGGSWQGWVYTKAFRRHEMKTRDGERPSR